MSILKDYKFVNDHGDRKFTEFLFDSDKWNMTVCDDSGDLEINYHLRFPSSKLPYFTRNILKIKFYLDSDDSESDD